MWRKSRANYNDLKNGVHETTEYLELFLRNLLLDENNELHNRSMHISGMFEETDFECEKADIKNAETDIRNKLLAFSDIPGFNMRMQGSGASGLICWSSEQHR